MHGTERMKVRVVSTGNPIVDKRKPCNMQPVTLEGILAYIENTVRDERVREEVKKAALGYPYQALPNFGRNIRQHIERAQKKIALSPKHKGELGEEPAAKEEGVKYGKEVF